MTSVKRSVEKNVFSAPKTRKRGNENITNLIFSLSQASRSGHNVITAPSSPEWCPNLCHRVSKVPQQGGFVGVLTVLCLSEVQGWGIVPSRYFWDMSSLCIRPRGGSVTSCCGSGSRVWSQNGHWCRFLLGMKPSWVALWMSFRPLPLSCFRCRCGRLWTPGTTSGELAAVLLMV